MLLHYRNLAIVLLFTMPLNHTMKKIEVRETAMTRAIIAASHRPLLGVASAYTTTKNVSIQQLYHVPHINYTLVGVNYTLVGVNYTLVGVSISWKFTHTCITVG